MRLTFPGMEQKKRHAQWEPRADFLTAVSPSVVSGINLRHVAADPVCYMFGLLCRTDM